MSCPSSIYTVITNYATTAGGIIPAGTIARRYGRSCQSDGVGITLVGTGYYDAKVAVTFVPTATGEVTVTLTQDGTPIQGATMTVQGTASEPCGLFVIAKARNCGCGCNSTLQATISAAGVASATFDVTKE